MAYAGTVMSLKVKNDVVHATLLVIRKVQYTSIR